MPISRRTSNKLDKMVRVVRSRDDQEQQIGYIPRPFLLCSLPFQKPPAGQRDYERHNGAFTLRITAKNPHVGLPFGADALVPVWVATKYQLQRRTAANPREIVMQSGAEFLKAFGLSLDGRTYQLTIQRFIRIYEAIISFESRREVRGRIHDHRESATWFKKIDLWYSRDINTTQLEGFENRIVLSEEFAEDLDRHPIPIDLRVTAALSDSPAAQWLYHWIVYRAHKQPAGQTAIIPLFGKDGVQGQMGVEGYEKRPRNFRIKLRHWLGIVRAVWPELPAALDAAGDNLFIESGHAIWGRKTNQTISLV